MYSSLGSVQAPKRLRTNCVKLRLIRRCHVMHSFVLHFNLCLPNVIPVSLHSTAVQLVIRLGTMGLLRNWFCIMTLWIIIVLVVAFSSLARILGECSIIHSPPALFFSFLFFFFLFLRLIRNCYVMHLCRESLPLLMGRMRARERDRDRGIEKDLRLAVTLKQKIGHTKISWFHC